MARGFTVAALLTALALYVTGCTGTPAQPASAPARDLAPAPGGESPAAPPPAPTPSPPAGLTERLLTLPAPVIQPTYRWPAPAEGMDYQPLPNGKLLVWPSRHDKNMAGTPFVVTALNTEGKVLWEVPLGRPASEGGFIDVEPRGRTGLLSMAGGEVHLLDLDRGEIYLTRTIGDPSDDQFVVGYRLTGHGAYMAVKERTPSGGIPWVLRVESTSSDNGARYGAEGTVVHASPYHEYIFGVADMGGLERKSPRGPLNVIDVEHDKLAWNPEMATSADGLTVYLESRKGIDVFNADGRRLFQIDEGTHLDTNFAPLSGHFWNELNSGQIDIYTGTGDKSTLQVDPKQVDLWRVMPGGEGEFLIPSKKAACVVQPDGTIVGCFPSVSFDTAGSAGKTFFWVTEPGGTIAAYNGK